MSDLLRKYKSLFSSTANSFSTGTGVTITPASIVGLPTDTEITLTFDRVNSSGVATSTAMERIIGTISAGNFVPRTSPSSGRGADSSTEQAHTSPVVEMIWNSKDWNDMITHALVGHDQDGTHKTFTTGLLKAVDVTSGSGVSTFPTTTDTLVGRATTDTLTNKRITKRTYTVADTATLTPEISTYDIFCITALAQAVTVANHSTSTPVDGDMMLIRFLDNGTARAITWGNKYVAKGGVALPSTTTLSKNLSTLFIWDANLSKWNLLAAGLEA